MKAILMSDRPKWCALMMNGDKTVEVRKGTALYKATKKLIDEYGFADFYVYCTKGNYDIVRESSPYSNVPHYTCVKINKKLSKDLPEYEYSSRGKVIFKFRCYKVEEINTIQHWDMNTPFYWTKTLDNNLRLQKASCLLDTEIYMYLGSKQGYAIHISDLEIFDEPKELDDFYSQPKKMNTTYGSEMVSVSLAKAPQSWCYIEVGE